MKEIAPRVLVSPGILYASKQRVSSRKSLYANARLLSMSLEELEKILTFSKDVTIVLDKIAGRNWYGAFDEYDNKAYIRYRNNFKSMLPVLAHELVHAEQFHTVRLYFKNVKGNFIPYWNGRKNTSNEKANYYYNQPWEVEARYRQEILAVQVYLNLLKRSDEMSSSMLIMV